jgi:hypothetical protein
VIYETLSKCFNSLITFISISQIAIFIRIAAITGIGRYVNTSNSNTEIVRVNIATKKADILLVAHDFTLNAVRTSTAVAGIPQTAQTAKFDNHNQNISLSFSKLIFVAFSAIFAAIIVSSIAITAITNAYLITIFIVVISVSFEPASDR